MQHLATSRRHSILGFQPCALRCGITIYTQIKDLDKWIRLPLPYPLATFIAVALLFACF
ncbi:hypothetical protein [Kingella sp. (in: b-proteobacteria)]|uniref:hypothetical protein n=1 Tax=Kingella sp. (in: b-proteobacteria) TaxID=2020713 RepID=UPI0026DCD8CD|nr:hypothetical protein [Kingella sp. (in: b-proteobacteria)]MDO4658255.1 hypothetical protein [Kingella sp. (in: b-proteobacteria)]